MFFFFLFLAALLLLAYLLVRQQNLLNLRLQDQDSLEQKSRELSDLKAQLLTHHNIISELQGTLNEVQSIAESYKTRLDRLAKFENFKTLVEIDNEVEQLREKEKKYRAKIDEHIAAANLLAEKIIAEAQAHVDKIKEKEKEYRAKINEHITSANLRGQKIIDQANKRAEEIAGDAVNVARDFRRYEQAVKAMKNIIDGYGNKYIIPGQSLLDELAEIYGHTQAGQELKRAREHAKQIITNGTAAKCDYVEVSRKDIAITFVVDAFNGKIDSILSRSKRDNYGTLRQEILDSFTIVNLNGRAFRNAEITETYLNARLDELKWACAVHEVRQKNLEEQRILREQMREEEKARREYERAIKDAAKEEQMLHKALEITQRKMEEATAEQKQQYEVKLKELQEKLIAAEEKNKRALSMAQQTRSGHIYIISNIGSFGDGIYKIGMTRRLEPMDRVKELGDASVPFDFDVHALIYSDDAPLLERTLHKHFILNRVNKVNHRREFFRANVTDIKQKVSSLGLQAHWTMAAEARQYYETKAIEDVISNSDEERDAWIKSQYRIDDEELQAILTGNGLDVDDESDI